MPTPHKRQILLITAGIYTLTFISCLTSYSASHTFLHMTLQLTSGVNMLVLVSFVLLNLALAWHAATYLLFGELRLIEQEHIFERAPFSVLGIVVMTSMFSEYHLVTLLALSACLIGAKIYHWILRDRLDQRMQTAGAQGTTTNSIGLRQLILSAYTRNLALFLVVDTLVARQIWRTYLFPASGDDDGVLQTVTIGYGMAQFQTTIKGSYDSHMSMVLLFGMEFCSLFLDLLNLLAHTTLQYTEFYMNELQQRQFAARAGQVIDASDDSDDSDDDFIADGLEGKYVYEKTIDLATQVAKTALHVVLVLRLQLVIVKDIVWDVVSLYKGTTELYHIHRNNAQLDDRLPGVSVQDLRDHDNVCIVCMDDLVHVRGKEKHDHKNENEAGENTITQADIDGAKRAKRAKKLPCGHMLHLQCLKNWMERSQTCPICRLAVFDEQGNVKPAAVAATPTRPASQRENAALANAPAPPQNESAPENWYAFRVGETTENAEGESTALPLAVETLGGTARVAATLRVRATARDAQGAVVVPRDRTLAEVPESTPAEHTMP